MKIEMFLVLISAVAKVFADLCEEGKIPWGTPYFWDKTISWGNKYSDDSIKDGTFKPRFFGSTSFLSFLVDGWHLMNTIHIASISFAVGIAMYDGVSSFICGILIYLTYGFFQELIRKVI
jgi:hypothetical protein